MGKTTEAETKLREAIKISRSEKYLSHLSDALRNLNRLEEAEQFALEAKNEYRAGVRRKFKNEASKDFELASIDGRKIKLSDLKGKVVMVNFWATWCKPCIKEMPVFVKVYDKYKDQGFEILAITVDETESRPQVINFATKQKINFPVLYDEGTAKLYGVHGYPTTVFIDKQGNVRYRSLGFSIENAERDLRIIIEELMKDSTNNAPATPTQIETVKPAANPDEAIKPATNPELRNELLKKVENDSFNEQNTKWIKQAVTKYGWLGKTLVRKDGAAAAFRLVYNAEYDREFQNQSLVLLEKAVKDGEAPATQLAQLIDRTRNLDKKPQVYGTLLVFAGGKLIVLPIEDEANVDKRRATMGLEPFAAYVEKMRKKYINH